jgi:hypothetical protein
MISKKEFGITIFLFLILLTIFIIDVQINENISIYLIGVVNIFLLSFTIYSGYTLIKPIDHVNKISPSILPPSLLTTPPSILPPSLLTTPPSILPPSLLTTPPSILPSSLLPPPSTLPPLTIPPLTIPPLTLPPPPPPPPSILPSSLLLTPPQRRRRRPVPVIPKYLNIEDEYAKTKNLTFNSYVSSSHGDFSLKNGYVTLPKNMRIVTRCNSDLCWGASGNYESYISSIYTNKNSMYLESLYDIFKKQSNDKSTFAMGKICIYSGNLDTNIVPNFSLRYKGSSMFGVFKLPIKYNLYETEYKDGQIYANKYKDNKIYANEYKDNKYDIMFESEVIMGDQMNQIMNKKDRTLQPVKYKIPFENTYSIIDLYSLIKKIQTEKVLDNTIFTIVLDACTTIQSDISDFNLGQPHYTKNNIIKTHEINNYIKYHMLTDLKTASNSANIVDEVKLVFTNADIWKSEYKTYSVEDAIIELYVIQEKLRKTSLSQSNLIEELKIRKYLLSLVTKDHDDHNL